MCVCVCVCVFVCVCVCVCVLLKAMTWRRKYFGIKVVARGVGELSRPLIEGSSVGVFEGACRGLDWVCSSLKDRELGAVELQFPVCVCVCVVFVGDALVV